MTNTLEKVETLSRDGQGNISLELLVRTYVSGSKVFYARSRIYKPELANQQKRLTKSLQTDEYEKAKELAWVFHSELKHRQDAGVNVSPITVNEALDRFLKAYEENLKKGLAGYTPNILRNLRKSVHLYWREYVGSKNLEDITHNDMEGYEEFRRGFAKTTKSIRNKWRQNYKSDVALATLKGEINYFRQFLRWCVIRNLYQGSADEWTFKTREKIANRREALHPDHHRKLIAYMRSKKFLDVGRHKDTGAPDRRIQRHRHMLRCYILLVLNTGLRVGECRHIRWHDISVSKNSDNEDVPIIYIDQNYSKVQKGNRRLDRVLGRNSGLLALQRFRDYLISIGEKPEGDRFIFCSPEGKPINHFREGFQAVLKEAGVEKDIFGNPYVIYSLRHTYITLRLKHGDMTIHQLAKNTRTSVAMIEQHYDSTENTDHIDALTMNKPKRLSEVKL